MVYLLLGQRDIIVHLFSKSGLDLIIENAMRVF
jgi:hypothetical protein